MHRLFRLSSWQESINRPQDFAPEDFAAVYADTNLWLVVRLGHSRGASVRAADEKRDRCLLGGRPVRSLYAASRSHWSAMISNTRRSLSLRHAFAWLPASFARWQYSLGLGIPFKRAAGKEGSPRGARETTLRRSRSEIAKKREASIPAAGTNCQKAP
jgi:hypothetical protein